MSNDEQQKQPAVEPWVYCKVLIATLIGRVWRNIDDKVALPLERAKKLKADKVVEFSKHDVELDQPMPVEEPPKVRRKQQAKPKVDTSGGNGGGDGNGETGAKDDRTFDDLGIVGKTRGLLTAGGIDSADTLRAKIADGLNLTDLDGIGKATAESILAALQSAA